MDYKKLSDIELEINSLDGELTKLSKMYELYFLGLERFEPIKERDKLTRRLRLLQSKHAPQTSVRFKMGGLMSRFATYQAHWDRTVRKIEDGTYFRQQNKSSLNLEAAQKVGLPSNQSVDQLYCELVNMHDRHGLNSLPEKKKFESFIQDTRQKLIEKHGHDQFKFGLKVSDGKIKVTVIKK